jgi:salicylate hydroxylase
VTRATPKTVLIAGAGIAGLTAALFFAQRGFSVAVFERAASLEEAGAGLQLSPNATRILGRLGVLPALAATAVAPSRVVLRRGSDLGEIGRVPLGEAALRRWGAPYLTAHRADLQQALLGQAHKHPGIALGLATPVTGLDLSGGRAAMVMDDGKRGGLLVVGADGVWSRLRHAVDPAATRAFSGHAAFRSTVTADSLVGRFLAEAGGGGSVIAFLHPAFHLVAYPVRAGDSFNLAGFMARREPSTGDHDGLAGRFADALARTALRPLAQAVPAWSVWPLHTVSSSRWTLPEGAALIGDAAHAMTPFAAQGAAMAIEDAERLAAAVAGRPGDLAAALSGWERERRQRVRRVARRGALNRLAWHAAGPVALARDLLLTLRRQESFAADLDWLYGYDAEAGSMRVDGPEPS